MLRTPVSRLHDDAGSTRRVIIFRRMAVWLRANTLLNSTITKHRLDKHMEKTAVGYILRRIAGADDHVSRENQNKKITEDDEKKREQSWFIYPKVLEVTKA